MSNQERYVEMFTAYWNDPDPRRYAEHYHREANITRPGGGPPISPQEAQQQVAQLKALIPDLRLKPTRTDGSGDALWIEWLLTGTVAGQKLQVRGADRITLKGDRVIETATYYDSLDLLSAFDQRVSHERLRGALAATLEAAN